MSVSSADELPSRPSPGAAGARLGELYTQHSRLVYGICRMLLRDPDEAEDATQQVFLSAYRNLLTGTEVRDPAAWLGTIARNACRRRAIARMREALPVDEELTLVSPAADEQASGRADAAALYAELAALPEKQREAVVLRDLYGLRYDEVAVALGTSRPAVEALLFRGRRRLQHRLRPGFAAGVLVVPLAVQDSIAYAVPGFASTAGPAGAVAAAAGIPVLAKLAAAGAAVTIAGSAGYAAERRVHDSPRRPADTPIAAVIASVSAPPAAEAPAGAPSLASSLAPMAPAASNADARVVEQPDHDESEGKDDSHDEHGVESVDDDAHEVESVDDDAHEAQSVDDRARDDSDDGEEHESDAGEHGDVDADAEQSDEHGESS